MPISPEYRTRIGLSAGVLVAVGSLALTNEWGLSAVTSYVLVSGAEVPSQTLAPKGKIAQQAGALSTERVFADQSSRTAETITTIATTTTNVPATTIAPKPIVKPPPTTQANTPPTYPVGCDLYKPMVQKYDWPVEQAMLTMSLESGCDPNKVSATNDYGLMQLHNEPIYDPEANIRRGYEKYVSARRGSRNFSAWYAVCTRGNNPQPKYPGITCQ